MIDGSVLSLQRSVLRAKPSPKEPRICIPTITYGRKAFQCGLLEAQDVLAETDAVEFVTLEPTKGFESRRSLLRRCLYHDRSRRMAFLNPGLRPLSLKRDYDLLILVCPSWWDVFHINAIQGWKDRCETTVCWIDELWAGGVSEYKYWLPFLRSFDHVILGMHGSVAPVSCAIGKPCHYVPGGVDALRFSPYPSPPKRVVDIYSIGRRWPEIHRALVKHSRTEQLFYLFDTLQSGDSYVRDHREHRDLYASVAKRSRIFMVAPPKMDTQCETGGQVEIPFRYYEGAAAGTVMLGQSLDCEPYRQMFNWENAVIEVSPGGSDVVQQLSRLFAEPELTEEIGRRNTGEALLRHDWVYRWKKILSIAGLSRDQAMDDREKRLHELAAQALGRLS